MKSIGPLFTGFTWGTGESAADVTIQLSNTAQNEVGCIANVNLTWTNLYTEETNEASAAYKKIGVRNIVALPGDLPCSQKP